LKYPFNQACDYEFIFCTSHMHFRGVRWRVE